MAITAHPACDYSILFAEAASFLGIAANPESTQILSTAPYTPFFLKKRIVQADIEIITLICSVQDHPYRGQFISEEPDPIGHDEVIPAYMGVHAGVRILAGDIFLVGDLATDFDHFRRVRDFPAVYGQHPNLYWIENGRIQLIDESSGQAKVYVPTIPVEDVTPEDDPTLYSPRAYQNGLLGNVLGNMRKVGSDSAHRNDWFSIWQGYRQMIMGKALSLPEPERLQRIAS